MQAVDRAEHAELQPAQVQLLVTQAAMVAADVVAPPAVAHIGRRRGEIGHIVQKFPVHVRIAAEADRIAVRADTRIARQDQPISPALHAVKIVIVVQRPQGIQPRERGGLALLPVDPPEIDPLVLQRMVQQLQICVHEAWICNLKRHNLFFRRVQPHALGHGAVGPFVPADAQRRVQIERDVHPARVKLLQKRRVIWKERFIPCVARPAVRAAVRLVIQPLFPQAEITVDLDIVPIHVDDGNGDGNPIVGKIIHQIQILLLRIRPITAPPVAQRPAREHRRAPAQVVERTHGGGIVVPVGKDVAVRPAARKQSAVRKQQQAARIVVDRRAVSCANALLQRNVRTVVARHVGMLA